MGLFFLGSWAAQGGGRHERLQQRPPAEPPGPGVDPEYALSANFWNRTLQNWQSEFLAVGSMVVLSIYLRQRGSPESKPVGSAHATTGVEG